MKYFIKKTGEWIYKTTLFTSAMSGSVWSDSILGHFTSVERAPQCPLDRRLGEPQDWLGRCGRVKILDSTGIQTPPPRSFSQ
jgi:hypothetical protein